LIQKVLAVSTPRIYARAERWPLCWRPNGTNAP
jgi:hypothetical protein